MRDPRFSFRKKYGVNPNGILNFFFIEGIKLKHNRTKYRLYKMTWNYARNCYNLNIPYHRMWWFLHRYEKFMKWLQKGKPVNIYQ